MNEVEVQADGIGWGVDESDVDYDSDASLSDSDGSEGEVPVVTGDVKDTDPSGKPLVGAAKTLSKVPAWSPKSATIATPVLKESSFTRGWKPVIDGKIQVAGEAAALKVRRSPMQAGSTATSSQKRSSSDNASASPPGTGISEPKKDGNESDSDVRRVPEMSLKGGGSGATSAQPPGHHPSGSRSRKRGGAPADKEHKRLKRLLRNRVSAQQARERKKAYLSDLEVRSKELQQRNEELEERVSTLQRENYMLRQIVKNTALKKPGSGGAGTEI